MRLMMEVLDADQQQALKDIMTSYRSQMEQVMRAMKDGTKDEATVKAEIEALERAMKNEIDSLLTDEQRDKIETMQSEMKQKMEDIRLAERDAMISALNMSSDQVTLLESINKKYEEELVDALRINFEFFTFRRICDHALITSSLIFLKLLNEPNVMKLFFSNGKLCFFRGLSKPE